MYHSIILEDFLDLYHLAQVYGHACPARLSSWLSSWRDTINHMRAWLQIMCHPDGDIAFFNDATHGVALSPAQLEAYAHILRLGDISRPQDGITHLLQSGYVRLQTPDAVAILDVGEIGPAYTPGHAHADTLAFELSLFGARVLVNSGISTYQHGPERQWQRSTAAHNTVLIDGVDSSEIWGEFRVARRALPCDLDVSDQGQQGLVVSCAHDGYRRLPGDVMHRRRWRLTWQSLELQDVITGHMSKAVARFHVHPQVDLPPTATLSDGQLRCSIYGRQLWWRVFGAQGGLEPSSYHPGFGVSVRNLCLVAHFSGMTSTSLFSWP